MIVDLYEHPFSSYCQKAKVAFYEKGVVFDSHLIDGKEPVQTAFRDLWPIGRFPVALFDGRLVFEATSIIDHLDVLHPAPRLVPEDPMDAAEVRMWDRFFDNYVAYPQQRLVGIALGREHDDGGGRWRDGLETAYRVLDDRMQAREWVAADRFSLADCGAAPFLLYADWSHPIDEASFPAVRAYRQRLLARPSYARALDEARPWRDIFPLGAPVGRD